MEQETCSNCMSGAVAPPENRVAEIGAQGESDLRWTVGEMLTTYFLIRSISFVGACRAFRMGTLSPQIRCRERQREESQAIM